MSVLSCSVLRYSRQSLTRLSIGFTFTSTSSRFLTCAAALDQEYSQGRSTSLARTGFNST